MNILLKSSSIQFKNPQIGQPTRAVKEHYNGRRVSALVDGNEKMYRFTSEELAFESDEDSIIEAITLKVEEETRLEEAE